MQGTGTMENPNPTPGASGGFTFEAQAESIPPLDDLSLPSAHCPGSDIPSDIVNESWTSGQNGDSLFPEFLSDMPWSDVLSLEAGYSRKRELLISASWMISPNTLASLTP